MNRIDRLFAVATHLQSRKFCTAESISEKFNISVRTVYRDVKALQEVGVPIGFEPAKGYFVVSGYFLAPLAFSTEEISALLVSEKLIAGFGDQSVRKHHSAALAKIRSMLRLTQRNTMEELETALRLQLPARLDYTQEHLIEIQQAIAEKCQLLISYTDRKQELTTRHVEPIGIVFYAFDWHVIGWCHLRQDYRDFRLNSISSLKKGQAFIKSDHIAFEKYELPVNY